MQQELQRDHPFLGVGCRVGEFDDELIDLIDNAGVRRTARGWQASRKWWIPKTSASEIRVLDLDIDEMPLSCAPKSLLAAVPVRVSVAISPHRRAGDIVSSQIISVGGEDASHLRSNPSIKKLLSDQCDSGMPFAAPSQERRWNKREDKEKGDEPDLQEPASRSSPRNPTSSAPNCTTACR